MTKHEIRVAYKQKRKSISPVHKQMLDGLLLAQLKQLPLPGQTVLLTYLPVEKHAEPDARLFISYLQGAIPGLAIAYPVINSKITTFDGVLVNENTIYSTNRLGIKEPWAGTIVNPATINVAFVPLLACDTHGYRVGYGKGFFDKYLATCGQNIIKVGFSYFGPVHIIDDIQPFDIPLNYLVTPEKIYEF